jgi:6,7-dimethyl-8-ribityllumazine synthase
LTPIMSKDKPESLAIDGDGVTIGIIAARYNFNLVNALLESVMDTLQASGAKADDIEIFRVPGSNEIPHAAGLAAKTGDFDVIIGLGLIIEGDTNHDEIIGHATANALLTASMQFEVPIINGIITVRTLEQAEERITGEHDRGAEFAHAALEMAKLNKELVARVIDSDLDTALQDLDWMDDDLGDDDGEDWRK